METNIVQKASEGNLTILVVNDTDAQSPRVECDNLGTMVCWHRRYSLGDKHSFKSPQEFVASSEFKNAVLWIPLYLYDHSGITISTAPFSCQWDSGQVGYIYVTAEKLRKEYKAKRLSDNMLSLARGVLESEVKVYDTYLTGEIYGFQCMRDDEIVCSVYGFYGDYRASGMQESMPEEFQKIFKEQIMGVVPCETQL